MQNFAETIFPFGRKPYLLLAKRQLYINEYFECIYVMYIMYITYSQPKNVMH